MEPTQDSCSICLDTIVSDPENEEDKKRILDCSHIFHQLCIGEWLKLRRQDCPLCRAPVNVDTPEEGIRVVDFGIPEEEGGFVSQGIGAIDLHTRTDPIFEEFRQSVLQVRRERGLIAGRTVQQISLHENTPMGDQARRVNAVAAKIFGFNL